MDISNVTTPAPVAPTVAKVTTGVAGTKKPAPEGNSLPESGQTRAYTENSQAKSSDSASAPGSDTAPASQPITEELHNLVEQSNEALLVRSSDLKFTVAEGTDINIIRIEDKETGELIRQIPSETMVAIARAFDESQQGVMLEEKA